jgi:hypothetical protein
VSDSFLPESDRYLNGADWQQALRKISVPVVLGVTANDGLASLGETQSSNFLMLNVTFETHQPTWAHVQSSGNVSSKLRNIRRINRRTPSE